MEVSVTPLALFIRYRTTRSMNMLRPYQVAGNAIRILPAFPYAALCIGLNVAHRLPHRLTDALQKARIAPAVMAAHFVSECGRFRNRKCHVLHYPPVIPCSRSKLLSVGLEVVAQPE